MTTTAIRKKLITYIADAGDKKVKGLYMLIEDDLNNNEKMNLSAEHLKFLDLERQEHLKGKSKSYTSTEAKQIIRGEREL